MANTAALYHNLDPKPRITNGTRPNDMSCTLKSSKIQHDDDVIPELRDLLKTRDGSIVIPDLGPQEYAKDAINYSDIDNDDVASDHDENKSTAASTSKPEADEDIAEMRDLQKARDGTIIIPDLGPQEYAEDAIDYGDIDDDDLADDEDGGPVQPPQDSHLEIDIQDDSLDALFGEEPEVNGAKQGASVVKGLSDQEIGWQSDLDLFGERLAFPESDFAPARPAMNNQVKNEQTKVLDSSPEPKQQPAAEKPICQKSPAFNENVDNVALTAEQAARKWQEELFARSSGAEIPAPPEDLEEFLAAAFPKFEKDKVPRFLQILPPKKAHYVGKTPLKIPKPVRPTKVNLELAPDQEKQFCLNTTGQQGQAYSDKRGIVYIKKPELNEANSDDDILKDVDLENEKIGNVTWNDLKILCADWDCLSSSSSSPTSAHTPQRRPRCDDEDTIFGDVNRPPAKRQKTEDLVGKILAAPCYQFPSFDNPEELTAKVAKRVTLDLNDPHLLLDIGKAEDGLKKLRASGVEYDKDVSGSLTRKLKQRFNLSNDEAYDLLKENHQNKVRSTLGNVSIQHSMPAQRLQWPYYQTKLSKTGARTFHRPRMHFAQTNVPQFFSTPNVVKRKDRKGKEVPALFATTKDLSLGDNSHLLLLEYSEEHPTTLSNFGMGSRLINYYRRKNMEDDTRPKLELGETQVLMPQDKSPFSTFGHIDPGETTPTFHNAMFKAPVFKQDAKKTDFLFIRNRTGVEGSRYYIRSIDNLMVVGQEFPSVDVPGPHSRKVTTAAKNRLKMISYRIIKRKRPPRISVNEVTKHFPETTDMQNRQKMKEFMQFSKEHKEWEMRPGESVPGEEIIRALIKPEDVCLLEAMQVGQQHLLDAGFSKDDDEIDEEDEKEGPSLEQQLAPWHTTRNFINATQGKAMLQLHGEGDPSGRGEAFSFIKTSMKGGFQALGESANDKLDAARRKENGGHSYNVARQQKAYEDSIRRIWESQRASLSSSIEHSDAEMDIDHDEDPIEGIISSVATPRSQAHTPAGFSRHDDETMSQFSRFSTASQNGKILCISRTVTNEFGVEEVRQEVVRDHRVIRQYLKRRHEKEALETKLSELAPTGDPSYDARAQKMLEVELARLERNKERRLARDKMKGVHNNDGSPSSIATPGIKEKTTGTLRKCANCGQVGHIKTNKKLCPMLNGSRKHEEALTDSAFLLGNEPPTL